MIKNLAKGSLNLVFGILISLFLCLTLRASEFPIIYTEELKRMMDEKRDFILIDTRSKEEYEEAHLPSAINIPEKDFEKLAPELLKEKEKLLIFYCNGVKCGKSKRTAVKAQALGYKNLAIYAEGIPVWEERGLPLVTGPTYEKKIQTRRIKPEELKKLIDEARGKYVLIDVRDESEYREGHIPTAINIPAEVIASKSELIPKDKIVIVYCNTGGRSYLAYKKLLRMEYKNLYQALFAEWKEKGFPIEK